MTDEDLSQRTAEVERLYRDVPDGRTAMHSGAYSGWVRNPRGYWLGGVPSGVIGGAPITPPTSKPPSSPSWTRAKSRHSPSRRRRRRDRAHRRRAGGSDDLQIAHKADSRWLGSAPAYGGRRALKRNGRLPDPGRRPPAHSETHVRCSVENSKQRDSPLRSSDGFILNGHRHLAGFRNFSA